MYTDLIIYIEVSYVPFALISAVFPFSLYKHIIPLQRVKWQLTCSVVQLPLAKKKYILKNIKFDEYHI